MSLFNRKVDSLFWKRSSNLPTHTATSHRLNINKLQRYYSKWLGDIRQDLFNACMKPLSQIRLVLIIYIWSPESFFLPLSNGEAVLAKWLMASMPANKWQGIFLVFHHIFSPAEAPQWLLIQCLFIASDDGFQMRLCYNESDMSMWPLGWSVCCGLMWSGGGLPLGLSQLPLLLLSISQPEQLFIHFYAVLSFMETFVSSH